MKCFGLTLLMCSLLFPCSPAAAQETQTNQAPRPQDSDTTSPHREASAQPSEQLKSLAKSLSGEWSLSVKFEPNPEMPNGFAGTGEETWRAGPGGFTLLEEERIPTPAGDVYLLGIIWWDSQSKTLRGMECNNQLPYSCDPKGALNDITMTWDGKRFAIKEHETHEGKKTMWHEVWSDITANSFTQTGDVEEPGVATKRFFTMHARRVEGSSSNTKTR